MTVADLEARMSSREFEEWRAFWTWRAWERKFAEGRGTS